MLKEQCHQFIFQQRHTDERIALSRIILGAIVFLWCLTGPGQSYYLLNEEILYQPVAPFSFFPKIAFLIPSLKVVILISALSMAAGFFTRSSTIILTISFSLLNYYMLSFHETFSTETNHFLYFLLAMCFAQPNKWSVDSFLGSSKKSCSTKHSAILAFFMMYVAMLYLQAGATKWIHSGFQWFYTGDTIYIKTITEGTAFGRFFAQWPILFPLFGIGTAVFEFLAPLLVFFPKYHVAFVLMCLSFHLGTYLFLGISFWFLWPLFLPLFLFSHHSVRRYFTVSTASP